MTDVRVSRLTPAEIDDSFVLAQLGYPELTLVSWRQMVRRQLARPDTTGGLLIARDLKDELKGLLLYSMSICIAAKPCVQVERLVAFDLSNPSSVADALVAEVSRLGHQQGCDAMSLVRPWTSPANDAALVLKSGVAVLCQMF